MALRGHASIQGSTDIPTLFNLLPGYLPMPKAGVHDTFADYLDAVGSKQQKGFWANADAYTISLLKAWWGDAARAENDWCLRLSAAAHRPARHLSDGDRHARRRGGGLLPAGAEPGGRVGERPDAASGHGAPEVAGGARPEHDRIGDLVEGRARDRDRRVAHRGHRDGGVLPARGHPRGEGRIVHADTASAAVAAPGVGAARTVPERTALLLRTRQADPGDSGRLHRRAGPAAAGVDLGLSHRRARRPRPRVGAGRDQRIPCRRETGALGLYRTACRRIHRRRVLDLHRGVRRAASTRPPRRVPQGGPTPSQSEWGWAWPADRRILYNRASADPDGKPWSERKRLVWWDEQQGRWVGDDVPDFVVDRAPHARPAPDVGGPDALAGDDPFVMQADGKGWLFAPKGMVDGPLPTHYEPQESPVREPAVSAAAEPRANRVPAQGQSQRAECRRPRRRRLPVRVHHLPAHRAPHRRRDEPLAAVPIRATAGDVLRGLPGTRRRTRTRDRTGGRRSSRRAPRSRRGCWSPSG